MPSRACASVAPDEFTTARLAKLPRGDAIDLLPCGLVVRKSNRARGVWPIVLQFPARRAHGVNARGPAGRRRHKSGAPRACQAQRLTDGQVATGSSRTATPVRGGANMPARTADAEWRGNLTEGKGEIKLGSGAFHGRYDWRSRSADGDGTNPEELIAAAHAGCFSMALAHMLSEAGHVPVRVHTTARVQLDKVGD